MEEKGCFTFGKDERVSGKMRIDNLFAAATSFLAYPFRISYHLYQSDSDCAASVLIGIPKKRLKKAVDRNRMKRVAREAYRLNKNLLKTGLLPDGFCIDIAFIYVKNELSVFTEVQKGIRKAIGEINVKLEKMEVEK